MATAPRPGKVRQEEEREQAKRLVNRIIVRGEELLLRHADLGPADAELVRRETGMTLRSMLATAMGEAVDFDVIAALWWLAQRKQGLDVSYEATVAAFPSYADVNEVRIIIDVEDGEDKDPESPEA